MPDTDVYLRAVPSDTDPDDVRLYDPTIPDAPAGGVCIAAICMASVVAGVIAVSAGAG